MQPDMMLSCANCGKGEEDSDKLKKCGACLSVKYCSATCQKAHRPQHKKECKKRAAELYQLMSILYEEQLFKEVEPDECPLCFLSMPICGDDTSVSSCCGKRICNGCVYGMEMSEGGADLCAFCRTPKAISNEEEIKRTKKLMDKGNVEAFLLLSGYYIHGSRGLAQDWKKALDLMIKAGELGSTIAYYNLGVSYSNGMGVEVDENKAKRYFELAAMGGDITARHHLGALDGMAGNERQAIKHFILAARAGHERALEGVKLGYMVGIVTKEEYGDALRSYQVRQDEMKSDARDKARSSSGIFMR